MLKFENLLIILFVIIILICMVRNIKEKESFNEPSNKDLSDLMEKNIKDIKSVIGHNTNLQSFDYIPHLAILDNYEANINKYLNEKQIEVNNHSDSKKEQINQLEHAIEDIRKQLIEKNIKDEFAKKYKVVKSYNNGQELSVLKKQFNDYMLLLNNGCLSVSRDNNYKVEACNSDDPNQSFKIQPIYNKTEYKNHLDKNSRRLINPGELKYPFVLVKSESNNNCLKNFHGKLSVEPCVESNGQMWQPLMKERKCQ